MPKPCAICLSVNRPMVDAMLASKEHRSPERIARTFPIFSRRKVRHHRDVCLGGYPEIAFRLSEGIITLEEVEADLRAMEGYSEAAKEQAIEKVRRLAEDRRKSA